MKSVLAAFAACLVVAVPSSRAWEMHSPRQVHDIHPGKDLSTEEPYSSAGYLRTYVGKETFSGSAAVAQDPRLLFSCAHVMLEKGRWAGLVGFRRAWNAEFSPDDAGTVFARGYYVFSGYTGSKKRGYDFDLDFSVSYAKAGEVFGPSALGLNEGPSGDPDGLGNLTSTSVPKLILGYPAYLDYNLRDGYYYMHQTGPFYGAGPGGDAFYPIYLAYYGIDYVSTGPGNSGGPVLVWKDSAWRLAGILISGAYDSAGIYAIDSYAKSIANSALAAAASDAGDVGANTFTAAAKLKKPLVLADGGKKYSSLKVGFSRIPGATTKVLLDLDITAPKRGDLDAYVRSPAGRVYVVASADPGVSGSDLVLDDHDISAAFSRTNPNGKWEVFVRDSRFNGSRVQVNAAALQVTSL